jgi:hypothetical protein
MSKLSENLYVRTLVQELLREMSGDTTYKTMGGNMIKFGSQSCVDDIAARITDTSWIRDTCPGRSDSRGHYNGVLNVLRRQKRAALKEFDKMQQEEMLTEED